MPSVGCDGYASHLAHMCCTQVLLSRRSAFDKSHNLFTICCLRVLLVVMLIPPNNLGLSVMACFAGGLAVVIEKMRC